jgi:hypothetical protein
LNVLYIWNDQLRKNRKASTFEEAPAYIKKAMSLSNTYAEASHGPEINAFFISKMVSTLHDFCPHQHQSFIFMIVSISKDFMQIPTVKIFPIIQGISICQALSLFTFFNPICISTFPTIKQNPNFK